MPRATWTIEDRAVRAGNTFYSRRLRKHKHCVIIGVRNGLVTYRRMNGGSGMTLQDLTATRDEFEAQFNGWGQSLTEIHAEEVRLRQIQHKINSVWHEAHVENFTRDLARLGGEETVQRFRDLMAAQDEVGAQRGAEQERDCYCSNEDCYEY